MGVTSGSGERGTIVVGVDGSDTSLDALRWARDEAARRGASLHLVHAWSYPYVGDVAGMAAYVPDDANMEANARAVLDDAVALATEGGDPPAVTTSVVHGAATQVLLDASAGADLLVVGSHGRGGFAGLLLGSVSQQCAHHATCPLVIVPKGSAR